MSVTLIVFRQILVMGLLIALGWVLARRGVLNAAGSSQIASLLTVCVIPVVIFSAFLSLEADVASLLRLGQTAGLCAFSFAFSITVACLLFRKKGRTDTALLRCCTVFTNNGFFGLPVVQALFGEQGVFYASISVLCCNLLLWTWGALQFQGQKRPRAKDILRQPAALAALAGLAVFALRLSPAGAFFGRFPALTAPLQTVVDTVKAMNTPLAMLVLGVNIYTAHWKPDAAALKVLPQVGLRQLLLPLVILGLTMWLPLDRTLIFSVYIEAACPIALLVSVLAVRHTADEALQRRAAGTVVVSTLSSLLTVPLMVFIGDLIL